MNRSRWYAPLTALAGGIAAALAHPPFGLLPGLLGYSLILLRLETVRDRPLRSAFGLGWMAGLGYFAVSTWWVVEPFLVEPEIYGWMAPFGVVFMAGGLALFWGAAGLAYRALRPRSGWKALVFAGVFAAAEWARGHVLTGFPWDLPGESWRAGSAPSQAAALVGAYGLTWITLFISSAPALVMLPVRRLAQAGMLAAAGIGLTLLYAGGAGRLAAARAVAPAERAPLVRIVQADIDQKEKWKPENLELVFEDYARLTVRHAARTPDIVIWPEGALPALIDDFIAPGSPYAPRMRDLIQPGQTLLMGANRYEPAGPGKYRYYNTLIALRRDGDALWVAGHYDKYRLVPFGEYLPLGDLAGKLGIRSLVHMPEDFTAGPRPKPLSAPGAPPFQPLICYEALFPGLVHDGTRPAWILNISNDAWFGTTSGPLQHLNIASYRAIEQGLPMVRSTPTGVSAVIDAYGRIQPGARLGLGAFGVIDAPLPPALKPTPYARLGDGPFAGLLILSALAWFAGRRRRPRAAQDLQAGPTLGAT
ncbi:MAG: apolipoprotein N-acyltransferase [Phenylobacterium sp.]|uniref:apolipoprotein N-acyltransferase n=1 Tax=Phenylobacterium sp. TaxID=1871053 RepID=UPI0025CF95C8|nr:apolipoprotein N-acyltransferase [Phenylobacterium sp.]MBI1200765.1 apolipoprotein N-acyltransferase [Phenylobacterium sp.]